MCLSNYFEYDTWLHIRKCNDEEIIKLSISYDHDLLFIKTNNRRMHLGNDFQVTISTIFKEKLNNSVGKTKKQSWNEKNTWGENKMTKIYMSL
mmetsp:Transcript_9689/g.18113  ORF Transcript_9689/g.18113 Transcript_9689/m.18113 type:complete len:93 (+) Transcript_9689:262-540(+)